MASELDYANLSNEEIIQKLDDAAFISRFETSEDWKLFREACRHLALQAGHILERTDPLKEPSTIIECQVVKKFCSNMIHGIVNGLKNEGKLAFDEAKDRGLRQVLPDEL